MEWYGTGIVHKAPALNIRKEEKGFMQLSPG